MEAEAPTLPDLSRAGIVHASAVAVADQAALILGPSGAGKSALALRLVALGAGLIADDRTRLTLHGGRPLAACPDAIRGRIEARGVGLIAVPPAPPAPVALVVDLSRTETQRLPPPRHVDVLGQKVRLLLRCDADHFPSALLLYLQGGPSE